jgi:hypothetical protein
LTPAQEFREARDWFAQHKRDPFLWLVILLPLTFATLTIGIPAILMSVFPFSDAKRALGQGLPSGYTVIWPKTICELPSGTFIFGYDLKTDNHPASKILGRVCRDVVNGGWVFDSKPKI